MTAKNNQTAQQASEHATDFDLQEVAESLTEIGEHVEKGIRRANRQIRSKLQQLDIDESTIPDTFRNVPKLIQPRVHAWLDFAVTAYFVGVGIWCATRGKVGAASAAFVNAGMVAGVSLMTDYEGTGKKPINFKLHGTLDAVQATTAALGPILHGFAGEPEAACFFGQAANEVAVIAFTDWDEGMPARSRKKAA